MVDDWQDEVDDWEDEAPRPGAAESFARGAAEGVSLGFQDELGGGFGALGATIGRDIRGLREGNLELNPAARARRALADYQRWRDVGRTETQAAREASPIAFGAGDVGAGVGTAILTGGGGGLARAAGVGATEGAVRGAGSSTSGLPEDVAAGAALGAVGGAAGYGLGKAVGAVRDRFRGLLARARGEATAQEATRAAGEAQQVAEQVAKQQEAERKVIGGAREMDKAITARRAEEAAAQAEQERRMLGQAYQMNRRLDARQQVQAAREAEAERRMVGQAREADKRFTSKAEREAMRSDEAERRMMGQAREMDKRLTEAERRTVGTAREMNKRFDERKARGLVRRARGEPRDLTDVELEGYLRQAHNEVSERLMKGESFRREFQRPEVPTRVTTFMQDYMNALDVANPEQALKEVVRRNLTRRLGPDEAARYFDEQGNLLMQAQRQARPAAPRAPEVASEPMATTPQPDVAPTPTRLYGEGGAPPADPLPEPSTLMYGSGSGGALPAEPSTRVYAADDAMRLAQEAMAEPATRVGEVPRIVRPARAVQPMRDFQVRPDVPTRTYGPEGVQALAGERVLAREHAALPTVLRAGAQGVRGSGNVLGGVVGGTSELARALNDPAVRARLLEELLRLRGGSPALLGRLGGAAGSMAGAEP